MVHNPTGHYLFFIFMGIFIFFGKEAGLADESKYRKFIKDVSNEIVKLKETYPQLKEFSQDKHVAIENLRIDYSYHTHDSERHSGWTAGVPNPDPDGIWFYVDLHDKDSMAQIHTQPIMEISLQFGDKSICFLILEGGETQSVSEKITAILEKNGARTVPPGGVVGRPAIP